MSSHLQTVQKSREHCSGARQCLSLTPERYNSSLCLNVFRITSLKLICFVLTAIIQSLYLQTTLFVKLQLALI